MVVLQVWLGRVWCEDWRKRREWDGHQVSRERVRQRGRGEEMMKGKRTSRGVWRECGGSVGVAGGFAESFH